MNFAPAVFSLFSLTSLRTVLRILSFASEFFLQIGSTWALYSSRVIASASGAATANRSIAVRLSAIAFLIIVSSSLCRSACPADFARERQALEEEIPPSLQSSGLAGRRQHALLPAL